jgi:ABC-type sulfate/molybdate transport systems ATPase subunit
VLAPLRTRCQESTDLQVRGPERIALLGRDGAGKVMRYSRQT